MGKLKDKELILIKEITWKLAGSKHLNKSRVRGVIGMSVRIAESEK